MTGEPVWRLIRRICRMSTAWRSERQGRCQISCTWLVECWWGKHIYSSTWWQGRKYPTKIPSTFVKLCHFLTVSHSWAKSFASCTWTKRLVAAPSSWMGAKAPCPGTTHEQCLSFGWTQEHLPSGHVPPWFDRQKFTKKKSGPPWTTHKCHGLGSTKRMKDLRIYISVGFHHEIMG